MGQYYEIRIKGHLDSSWSDWLDALTVRHKDDGETLLAGVLVDQAALHGVINRLMDLGILLISVNLMEPPQERDQEGDAKPTR